MLRSTDGAATWTRLGAPVLANLSISRILVDQATAGSPTTSTVFAATNLNNATSNCQGLLKSTNSGATWTGVLGGCVSDLEQDPSNPSTLYAGVQFNGVYKAIKYASNRVQA